jgi:hypothetical protein
LSDAAYKNAISYTTTTTTAAAAATTTTTTPTTTTMGTFYSQLPFKFTNVNKMSYSLNICPDNFLHMPKKPTNHSLATNGKVLLRPL